MANDEKIAKLISEALRGGLVHPGDPENDVPPVPIALPFSNRPGQPKEMTKLMDGTVKLIGEAIVHLIKTKGETELVPANEVGQLRQTAGEFEPASVKIHCRCDTTRTNPLGVAYMTHPKELVLDGQQLISGLTQRAVGCPHPFKQGS